MKMTTPPAPTGNGPNNTNANIFFGTMNEANKRDLHNENPSTVFFGSGCQPAPGAPQKLFLGPKKINILYVNSRYKHFLGARQHSWGSETRA
jgi:hypothetical protein